MKVEINKLDNGKYIFQLDSDDAMEIEILCTRHHRKLHYPDGKWGKNKKN